MTKPQIRNLKIAQGKVQMGEELYRILLYNVAGVASCKELSNEGYEDMMAVFEDYGFVQWNVQEARLERPDYWRRKVATRGQFANGRLVFKINDLYTDYAESVMYAAGAGTYTLASLTHRASQNRPNGKPPTDKPDQLSPREANNLIEMLKDLIKRSTAAAPEVPENQFATAAAPEVPENQFATAAASPYEGESDIPF